MRINRCESTGMDSIEHLAFVFNGTRNGNSELVAKLGEIASARGIKCRTIDRFPVPIGSLKGMDACCVIGGDGTFLSVAVEATREQVPVIGVNRGTLGFLTTYTAEEVEALFPSILAGEFKVQNRDLLECRSHEDHLDLALNDVVVKAADSSRIVHINVYADDEFVTTYVSDGLIFSTPTGSTAYTLSAGGPLLHPNTSAVSLTPICPHTLSNRAIIFPHDVSLRVESSLKNERLLVAIDGQRNLNMLENNSIEVAMSKKRLLMAQKLDYSHFNVVRQKLKWSGGYAGERRQK